MFDQVDKALSALRKLEKMPVRLLAIVAVGLLAAIGLALSGWIPMAETLLWLLGLALFVVLSLIATKPLADHAVRRQAERKRLEDRAAKLALIDSVELAALRSLFWSEKHGLVRTAVWLDDPIVHGLLDRGVLQCRGGIQPRVGELTLFLVDPYFEILREFFGRADAA